MRAKLVGFTEDSDPIEDMGIGTGNIDNLRYGSVLRARHEYQILDEDHYNYLKRVWMTGFGASLNYRSIDNGTYFVVLQAQYENGIVKVHYSRSTGGLHGAKYKKEFIDQKVAPEKRVQFADNFFRTEQKNMNKYFEFITFDF